MIDRLIVETSAVSALRIFVLSGHRIVVLAFRNGYWVAYALSFQPSYRPRSWEITCRKCHSSALAASSSATERLRCQGFLSPVQYSVGPQKRLQEREFPANLP